MEKDLSDPQTSSQQDTQEKNSERGAEKKTTLGAKQSQSNPKQPKKKTSGLSLKSIREKKDFEARKRQEEQAQSAERTGEFTEEMVQDAWKTYMEKLRRKGNKILASIMETDKPKVEDKKIFIKLPNDTMRKELRSIEQGLMRFIKKEINNTQIFLHIEVDESVSKKYAFTPKERYEKLKEKNPLIDKLRSNFNLEI